MIQHNCFNSVQIDLLDFAEFVVKTFAKKPHFSSVTCRKKLLQYYALPSHSKIIIKITKEIHMRTKDKTIEEKHETLRVPLDTLRSFHTISLLKVSKNKNNITSNRIFKVNSDGLVIENKSFEDELKECLQ